MVAEPWQIEDFGDGSNMALCIASTKAIWNPKIYTVCTILKNYHAILYGNQTSNYFNVSLPDGFIDYYINQEDLP